MLSDTVAASPHVTSGNSNNNDTQDSTIASILPSSSSSSSFPPTAVQFYASHTSIPSSSEQDEAGSIYQKQQQHYIDFRGHVVATLGSSAPLDIVQHFELANDGKKRYDNNYSNDSDTTEPIKSYEILCYHTSYILAAGNNNDSNDNFLLNSDKTQKHQNRVDNIVDDGFLTTMKKHGMVYNDSSTTSTLGIWNVQCHISHQEEDKSDENGKEKGSLSTMTSSSTAMTDGLLDQVILSCNANDTISNDAKHENGVNNDKMKKTAPEAIKKDSEQGIFSSDSSHQSKGRLFNNQILSSPGSGTTCDFYPPFIFTVDMKYPFHIASSIRHMISSLVNYFDKRNTDNTEYHILKQKKFIGQDTISFPSTSAVLHTTSVNLLKQQLVMEFGLLRPPPPPPSSLSLLDDDNNFEQKVGNVEHGSKSFESFSPKIAVIIACLMPDKSPSTYKDKQAQSLISYHLHRLAHALNCTLTFVRRNNAKGIDDCDDDESSSPKSISVTSLCKVVYQAALVAERGMPSEAELLAKNNNVIKEYDEDNVDTDMVGTEVKDYSLALILPNQHDETMIETTLRRNANCDGHWDVNKDSLEEALPLPSLREVLSSSLSSLPEEKKEDWDDEIWLSTLADSVKVSESKTTGQNAAAGAGKTTKTDKAESGTDGKKVAAAATAASDAASFFENLLKKKDAPSVQR